MWSYPASGGRRRGDPPRGAHAEQPGRRRLPGKRSLTAVLRPCRRRVRLLKASSRVGEQEARSDRRTDLEGTAFERARGPARRGHGTDPTRRGAARRGTRGGAGHRARARHGAGHRARARHGAGHRARARHGAGPARRARDAARRTAGPGVARARHGVRARHRAARSTAPRPSAAGRGTQAWARRGRDAGPGTAPHGTARGAGTARRGGRAGRGARRGSRRYPPLAVRPLAPLSAPVHPALSALMRSRVAAPMRPVARGAAPTRPVAHSARRA
ncbi:hypothetical protein JOF35_007165 [Streptomyces demainii]|uniref:Uncharacterized protein n=1 Tax=Streptomyces demainii TaxID=588122 RepID=A0ABT9L522_9ACTN|nr:hypothetical protein [Streptomyces demainii]